MTYEKEAGGKWKTVTKSDHELFGVTGGDACPAPSVNENSKKTDIYLTDDTGTHKPEYVLALTLSSNCFPHPTPLGQQQLAEAFHSQATLAPRRRIRAELKPVAKRAAAAAPVTGVAAAVGDRDQGLGVHRRPPSLPGEQRDLKSGAGAAAR